MDDLVIASITETENLEKLKRVLEVAANYGLNIKYSKCQFIQREVSFLGYVVKNGAITPSHEKSKAIRNFPQPKTVKQLQSFSG